MNVLKFQANASGSFEKLIYQNNESGKMREMAADGVFIFIGLTPNTVPFEGFINLSQSKHILTKGLNQTSIAGVFAAGDCRSNAIAQVAAATGEGVVASYGLKEYLKK